MIKIICRSIIRRNIIRRTIIRRSLPHLAVIAVLLVFAAAASGQTSSPTPIPPGAPTDSVTLSALLQQIVTNFVTFITAFTNTIERTLGGYFAVLAYILAWSIAVYYFIQQFVQGEWDAAQIGRFTGSIVVCLLLLLFCGDLDNDGKPGDLVRTPAYFGHLLSFGDDRSEPTGSYLNRQVKTEKEKFNVNYQRFIENKLMVKINDRDMPVRYPGMSGIQTVAAVSIGGENERQGKEVLTQEFWIGLLFQVMNFFRSVIEIIDFFLLVLYNFGILVCSIIAPFMVCVFVNRDFRKRFTYPFFWTVFTITVVFPAMSQTFRYFAYLAANIALGTGGNPVYTFDPATNTIISNGDPTPMILVAVLTMLISSILLVMSLILSYSFAQGKLVESMSGLIANTFAGLSSVGIGAVVASAATKMNSEAEKGTVIAAQESAMTQAGYQRQGTIEQAEKIREASRVSADGGYASGIAGARGERIADEQSLIGAYMSGAMGVQTQQTIGKMQSQAQTVTQVAGLEQQEKTELLRKSWDTYMSERGIRDDGEKERLLQESGILNLPGDEIDGYIKDFGILGTAVGTVFNGATVETGVYGRSRGGEPNEKSYNSGINAEAPVDDNFSMKDFIEKGVSPNLPENKRSGTGGGGMLIGRPSGMINPRVPYIPRLPNSPKNSPSGLTVSPDGTPHFKQGDSRWKNTDLGTGTGDMGAKGCAVSATAATLSKISGKEINPEKMDDYLDRNGGYDGDSINWAAAGGMIGSKAERTAWSQGAINKQIDAGRPVVAGVDRTGDGKTDHWVALTARGRDESGRAVYMANDPATGKQVAFKSEADGSLSSVGGKYRTTGELRTFSEGARNPSAVRNLPNLQNGNGAASQNGGASGSRTVSLTAPGIPKGLPNTLLRPHTPKISERAGKIPVANEGLVYYQPSQEAAFRSTGNKAVDSYILGAARTHGVNPSLLKAQFIQESGLRSDATSNKGAKGVAQLMPGTAAEVGVTDTRNPAQSIYGGAKYMRAQADRLIADGGVRDGANLRSLSLSSYNAGYGKVEKAGFAVPKISETQNYVQRITEAVGKQPTSTVKTPQSIKEDLGKLSRPQAEVYGKIYSQQYGEAKALERSQVGAAGSNAITRQSYGDQKQIAVANLAMQEQIYDTQASMQMQGIEQTYTSGAQSADTRYQTKAEVAEINRATGYQSSELQYEGSINQAAFQYEGTKASTQITKDAALDALYKRNMASLVQTIGSSAAHQFSELFERASRGL